MVTVSSYTFTLEKVWEPEARFNLTLWNHVVTVLRLIDNEFSNLSPLVPHFSWPGKGGNLLGVPCQ